MFEVDPNNESKLLKLLFSNTFRLTGMLLCYKCDSPKIKRNGKHLNGTVYYRCNNCNANLQNRVLSKLGRLERGRENNRTNAFNSTQIKTIVDLWENGKNIQQIYANTGHTPRVIAKYLGVHGYKSAKGKTVNLSFKSVELICNLYETTSITQEQLSKRFDVSLSTLKRLLKSKNVKRSLANPVQSTVVYLKHHLTYSENKYCCSKCEYRWKNKPSSVCPEIKRFKRFPKGTDIKSSEDIPGQELKNYELIGCYFSVNKLEWKRLYQPKNYGSNS